MKVLATAFLMTVLFLPALSANAKTIVFQCSWDNNKPIKLSVNTDSMTGTRDDKGKPYKVVKISDLAVWLAVDDPSNMAGLAIQMIQRKAGIKPANASRDWNKPGKWIDIVSSMDGMVSPIDGGQCWEME